MEFAVLGPFEAAGPDGPVDLRGAKERELLAMLALRAGDVVSQLRLIEGLWGEDPPASALKTLQSYVARVRRALEGAGMSGVLGSREPGYVLEVDPDRVDARRFEAHARAGSQALSAGDPARAERELDGALAVWRGEALADCQASGWAAAEALRLEELRLSAIESRVDAGLMLGRHADLVGEIESLVAATPFRERLWGALIVALYRSGRQSDALRAYQRARDLLVGELGLEPGAELRRLEAAVLAGDKELDCQELNPHERPRRRADGFPDAQGFGEAPVPLPVFVDTSPEFPFAGRVEAFEALLEAWKETIEGARRAVLVSGEPGIGKTRLVSELARIGHEQSTVLWGRCDEELGVAYEPFVEALSHYVATVPTERLRAEMGPLSGELTRILPNLRARVSGLGAPHQADSEAERHRLFEAVTDLLAEMSSTAPVVLVLDDIHWADKSSLLMLRHMLRAATPMRLLVLATYRDTDLDPAHPLVDVLADLTRLSGVQRLDLAGLELAEVESLMVAAGHDLDEPGSGLAQAVYDETRGNPFFVSEVLRHLVESGTIVQRGGRWTSGRMLEEIGVPESIREVVRRRLSRLSPPARDALALGAVIGADFDLATIEGSGGPFGDELFDALDEAAQNTIVREVKGTMGRYTFAHALVRSALYEALTTNRRVRMHWRIGEALEERHRHHVDEHLDELAYHFGEGALAGDPLKAVEYGRRAGERAGAELAFETAVRHFDRALRALELVDDPEGSERCDLQLALATALIAAGDERRRLMVFAAARSAREIGDGERLARAADLARWTTSHVSLDDEVVALLDEAIEALGQQPSALRSRLLSALAFELRWGPHAERRIDLVRQALALARTTRDPEALSAVYSTSWELVDGSRPFLAEMQARYDEAESVAADLGDPVVLVSALRPKAYLAACRGDRAAFEDNLAAVARITEGFRRPTLDWMARNDAAALAAYAGELERAEQLTLEAAELGRQADAIESNIMAYVGALLYQIRFAQGRIGELIPVLTDLVESQPALPAWRHTLADALVDTDRVDAAHPHLTWLARDSCANVAPDIHFPVTMGGLARMAYRIRPPEPVLRDIYDRLTPFAGAFGWTGATLTAPHDHGLAMTAAALGRTDDTDRHFTAAISLCERADTRAHLARCHFDWAHVLADRGDKKRAREHATTAEQMGTRVGMTGPHGVVPRAQALLDQL